jgi:hypothetical protein
MHHLSDGLLDDVESLALLRPVQNGHDFVGKVDNLVEDEGLAVDGQFLVDLRHHSAESSEVVAERP